MQTPARLLLHGVLRSLLRCPLLKSGPLKDKLLLLLLSRFSRVRLCDPINGSPPGSSVPGILQARILEWAAISFSNACIHAKSLQSCLTLCDPMDSSSPGSPVHRILQARIQEWVAISFSHKDELYSMWITIQKKEEYFLILKLQTYIMHNLFKRTLKINCSE